MQSLSMFSEPTWRELSGAPGGVATPPGAAGGTVRVSAIGAAGQLGPPALAARRAGALREG